MPVKHAEERGRRAAQGHIRAVQRALGARDVLAASKVGRVSVATAHRKGATTPALAPPPCPPSHIISSLLRPPCVSHAHLAALAAPRVVAPRARHDAALQPELVASSGDGGALTGGVGDLRQ